MLEEIGFQLIFEYDFPDAIDNFLKERGNEAIDLMQKMDALETLDKNKFLEADEDEFGPAIAKLKSGSEERVVRNWVFWNFFTHNPEIKRIYFVLFFSLHPSLRMYKRFNFHFKMNEKYFPLGYNI